MKFKLDDWEYLNTAEIGVSSLQRGSWAAQGSAICDQHTAHNPGHGSCGDGSCTTDEPSLALGVDNQHACRAVALGVLPTVATPFILYIDALANAIRRVFFSSA